MLILNKYRLSILKAQHHHLNTSYVDIKQKQKKKQSKLQKYLNTSYVDIKQRVEWLIFQAMDYLNTSYVDIKLYEYNSNGNNCNI